jgi:hypothetical protein
MAIRENALFIDPLQAEIPQMVLILQWGWCSHTTVPYIDGNASEKFHERRAAGSPQGRVRSRGMMNPHPRAGQAKF